MTRRRGKVTSRILSADASDSGRCASVLADAFSDDPLMATIWPDRGRRYSALTGYFDASLRHFHVAGGGVRYAVTDAGDIAAAAVWDPPGSQPSITRTLRALPSLLPILRGRTSAALGVRSTLDAHHPTRPHWYLANLGSSTARRGHGFAAALMTDQLARCDRDGVDAYLVCTSPDNIAFYEQFDFVVTEKFGLASGSEMTSMWRACAAR